jgi:hypothetical protein
MPCHHANDVIYIEEAKGDASEATPGVNAADMQQTGRFPVSACVAHARPWYTPPMA